MKRAYLIINPECNMDCTYCFLDKETSKFNRAAIFQSLRRFCLPNEEMEVSFFPEPFYNVKQLDDFCQEILLRFPLARFKMTTNGLNLAKLCVPREKIWLAVSIDGNRETHNRFRGHFDQIVRNIKEYKDYYGIVTARSTLCPETVANMYKDALFLWDEMGFLNIHYSFNENNKWSQESLLILREQVELIYQDYIKNARHLRGQQTSLFHARAPQEYKKDYDFCGVCNHKSNSIAIKQDGTPLACYLMRKNASPIEAEKYTYEHVLDEECKKCVHLSSCKTCPATAEKKTKYNCEFTKIVCEYTAKATERLGVRPEDLRLRVISQEDIDTLQQISKKLIGADEATETHYKLLRDIWWEDMMRKHNIKASSIYFDATTRIMVYKEC